MKKLLFTTTALIALAFENETSERCEVVFVKGPDGEPMRVNKSDFDADQADNGAKQYSEWKGDVEPEQTLAAADLPTNVKPMAAPSAPHFGNAERDTANIDPLKGAVAPERHGENSRLVVKEGKKYYAVDGQTGTRLTTEQLAGAENGFASEELAWTAIRALPH